MKKTILLVFLIFLLFFSAYSLIPKKTITSQSIYDYSFTKAICNSTNFCQDFEILCKDKRIIEIKSLNAVQFDENWQDPRTQEMKNKNC